MIKNLIKKKDIYTCIYLYMKLYPYLMCTQDDSNIGMNHWCLCIPVDMVMVWQNTHLHLKEQWYSILTFYLIILNEKNVKKNSLFTVNVCMYYTGCYLYNSLRLQLVDNQLDRDIFVQSDHKCTHKSCWSSHKGFRLNNIWFER